MSSYNRNKASKVWNGILAVLLVIVLAGAAALVGFLSDGFRDWSKFTDEEQAEEQQEEDGDAVVTEGESNGMRLMSARVLSSEYEDYGISTMAETAYTITATVSGGGGFSVPEDVVFTAAWANPASAWASGKTVSDYVSLSETGSNTATVSCLTAFGEQVIITATSAVNDSAYATCTVDYVKRVTFVSADGNLYYSSNSSSAAVEFNIAYSAGTLTPEVKITSISYVADSGLSSAVQNSSYFDLFEEYATQGGYSTGFTLGYTTSLDLVVEDGDTDSSVSIAQYKVDNVYNDRTLATASDMNALIGRNYFLYALKDAFDNNSGDIALNITWEATYGGEVYASGTTTGTESLDVIFSYSLPSVTSVSLSETSMIF